MDIAIDFDGTCVTHKFPEVGQDIGAAPVLKQLVANGHNLILYTMRSNAQDLNLQGNYLDDAISWFKQNDIPLYGIQTNPTQKDWTTSPKCYAQLYIDDAALGVPLLQDFKSPHTGDEIHSSWAECMGNKSVSELVGRPYVDWSRVESMLFDCGILKS